MEDLRRRLNQFAYQRAAQYQQLSIGGQKIAAPYAINLFSRMASSLMQQAGIDEEQRKQVSKLYKERAAPYGWYRGKGVPEELVEAAGQLVSVHGYDLENSSAAGIVEFMKLFGLGIDCSGFVFNVLDYAFSQVRQQDQFLASFPWPSAERTGINYAGTQLLFQSSQPIEAIDVQPLDFIFLVREQPFHVALVLSGADGLEVWQSSISCMPTGVNVSKLTIDGSNVRFEFQPSIGRDWDELLEDGTLSFRRLAILADVGQA